MPDIVYTVGYPDQAFLECVYPESRQCWIKVTSMRMPLEFRGTVGVVINAYMVTQTSRFKAAAPGALVANMTSPKAVVGEQGSRVVSVGTNAVTHRG
jgi:hypothetical protein